MRLHTNILTGEHLRDAAKAAGVGLEVANRHGSRKRHHAYEVRLSGHGVSGGGWGHASFTTATWDEWGMFLGHLFEIDPDMHAGPYKGASDDEYEGFHFLTGSRYVDLDPEDQHKRHRWQWAGVYDTYVFIPGGVSRYSEFECSCGALRRNVLGYVRAARVVA